MDFKQLGVSPEIVSSIAELGFTEPTPIQEKSIPMLLQHERDYIGLAQTGTGKTAAFGLPLIQLVDPKATMPQALIICPTRELCVQITQELKQYGSKVPGLKVVAVYGGASIERQILDIKKNAQIIVGTPGRMIDHLSRKTINLSGIKTVVLDEADEMLNMGFQEDIDRILSSTPKDKRVWLFSATMPQEVERIARRYMSDPFTVTIGVRGGSAQTISHQYTVVKPEDRYEALKRFTDFYPNMFGVLFVRTKRDAKEIAEKLLHEGYQVDALHGDLSQSQRDQVMKKFRAKKINLLIATDVAARGIDVKDITHVIHYGLPEDVESYTHRSGRTGRAGKSGVSLVLAHPRDQHIIKRIEQKIGKHLAYVPVPMAEDIILKQRMHLVQSIRDMEQQQVQDLKPLVDPLLLVLQEQLSSQELLERFATLYVQSQAKQSKQAKDLSTSFRSGSGGGRDFDRRRPRRSSGGGERRGGGARGGDRRKPRGKGFAPRRSR